MTTTKVCHIAGKAGFPHRERFAVRLKETLLLRILQHQGRYPHTHPSQGHEQPWISLGWVCPPGPGWLCQCLPRKSWVVQARRDGERDGCGDTERDGEKDGMGMGMGAGMGTGMGTGMEMGIGM